MFFEQVEEISTIIELKELVQKPECVYWHFMHYGDEVFYVLDNRKIYGIITLGDLYRTYLNKERMPQINCDFFCVENTNDYVGAQVIFDKYPTIHEVAVVKGKRLLGIIKSGFRKSWDEWNRIRQSLQKVFLDYEMEIEEKRWIEKDIKKILGIGCNIYIYRWLRVEDMGLSEHERLVYEEKRKLLPIEGLSTLTKREQKILFGDDSAIYISQLIKRAKKREIIFENGIPRHRDENGKIINIRDGYRNVPNAPKGAEKRIFMVGPCTMFGGLVSDERTIEAYLQEIILENGFQNYEVINCSVTGDLSFPALFSEDISEEDIIVMMSRNYDIWKKFEHNNYNTLKCLESMSEIWNEIDRPIDHVYNLVEHCDYVVNQKIAEKIFGDIKDTLTRFILKKIQRRKLQNYYISWDVVEYNKRHFRPYLIWGGGKKGLLAQ